METAADAQAHIRHRTTRIKAATSDGDCDQDFHQSPETTAASPPKANMHYLAFLLAAIPALVSASPVLESRATIDTSSHCGQWDSVTAGGYSLNLDQWGISGATGTQCAHLTSLSGTTLTWATNWTWAGGSGVKTFTDIQLNTGIGKQLSAIKSMPVSLRPCASVPV